MKKVSFKDAPIDYDQRILFPSNVFDLLPSDHECFVYQDIIDQLDTSELEQTYSVKGQHAYHPKLILGILIYSYSHGVFSSRQIEMQCNENLAFMYISHKNCPNFRVISDFRKDNHEFFIDCFKQVVLIAREAGMLSLGHVSLDGSKFDADTSKHKAMSYGRLKEVEGELVKEIEELLEKARKTDEEEDEKYGEKSGSEISFDEELKIKEKRLAKIKSAKESLEKREQELNPDKKIDDKKQISFADHDPRIMGKKGDFDYRYNGQISVDSDHQIIVGKHLSKNGNDKKEVEPALNEIKETTGDHPDKCSIDNGYFSGANLQSFSETNIDVYIATGKGEPLDLDLDEEAPTKNKAIEEKGKFQKSSFTYHRDLDSFICPCGHRLELKIEKKDGTKIYQCEKSVCDGCSYKSRCCSSKKGEARSIRTDEYEPLREAMREKMSHEESKEIYKKRKVIVEPVFGQIKNMGFRRFHVRGFQKASGEFSLVCSVHNIKKMVTGFIKGLVRLEGGKLVANRV
jgi:transposase